MDASASTKPDADITNVFNLFFKVDNTEYPTPSNQKCTVIKYTKLPDFDFDSKGEAFTVVLFVFHGFLECMTVVSKGTYLFVVSLVYLSI